MAGSLNRVTLIGNVGGDPEIKSLQNGTKFANLSVATSETWKDKNTGEKKEKTDWHRIVVWNEGIVGVIQRYVKKGSKVCIEGKLQTRKWQDQSGADRYSTEVVLQGFGASIILLSDGNGGGRRSEDAEDGSQQSFGGGYRGGTAGSRPSNFSNDLDDDIPFAPEFR